MFPAGPFPHLFLPHIRLVALFVLTVLMPFHLSFLWRKL
jgi:hypothetical protein